MKLKSEYKIKTKRDRKTGAVKISVFVDGELIYGSLLPAASITTLHLPSIMSKNNVTFSGGPIINNLSGAA